jgi:hypothetical protein
MEAELKLRLPSRAAYDTLVKWACGGHRFGGKLQTNIFFDTSRRALGSADYHLRLRQEVPDDQPNAVKWIVTAKGPKQEQEDTAGSSVHVRPEEEVVVPETVAVQLQSGDGNPLDQLPQSDLTRAMRAHIETDDAVKPNAGCFENTRVTAPISVETSVGTQALVLEMDATTFQHKGVSEVQWELEVELSSCRRPIELAGPVEHALQAVLREICGHECPPAAGKLSRLRSFCEAVERENASCR